MKIRIIALLLAAGGLVAATYPTVCDEGPPAAPVVHVIAPAAASMACAAPTETAETVALPSAAESIAVAPEYVGLFPNEMASPALAWQPRDGG